MSEQNKEKSRSSVSTIIATACVAVAAVAAIVVLIVMTKGSVGAQPTDSDGSVVSFEATQALVDECGKNAQELLIGNYSIVRLFVTEGLAHKNEPYGNRPEDGLYTVDSGEFKTFEEVEALVRSIFVEEEADRILTRMPSDPAAAQNGASGASGDVSGSELIAVYAPREVYVNTADEEADVSMPKVPEVVIPSTESGPSYVKKSVLGISEAFKPYTDYKKPWESYSIKLDPVSEEECNITVYLGSNKDVDLSSVEETDILNTKMVKTNGEWRLTELVY